MHKLPRNKETEAKESDTINNIIVSKTKVCTYLDFFLLLKVSMRNNP